MIRTLKRSISLSKTARLLLVRLGRDTGRTARGQDKYYLAEVKYLFSSEELKEVVNKLEELNKG